MREQGLGVYVVGGRLKFEEAEMRCGEEVWGEGVGRRGEGGRMND